MHKQYQRGDFIKGAAYRVENQRPEPKRGMQMYGAPPRPGAHVDDDPPAPSGFTRQLEQTIHITKQVQDLLEKVRAVRKVLR
jgi:hypothetical protein